MENRGLTNLLLAIIAGVLLFGKDAMVSGLRGLFFVAVAIFAIWLALAACRAIPSWIAREWGAANSTGERVNVVFATLAGFILTPLVAYTMWLWVTGVPRPIDVAVSGPLGWAWVGLVLLTMIGYALVSARSGLRWLSAKRSDLPTIIVNRLRDILWGYLEFLGGPVTFPRREWRIRSKAGNGTSAKIAYSAFQTFIGLIVSLMSIGLTIMALIGLLSWLGVLAPIFSAK